MYPNKFLLILAIIIFVFIIGSVAFTISKCGAKGLLYGNVS